MPLQEQVPHDDQPVQIIIDEPEPSQEPPSLPTAPPMPAVAQQPAPNQPGVSSTDMQLYEPEETFQQRRLRLDQHETMQFMPFGPMRRRSNYQ